MAPLSIIIPGFFALFLSSTMAGLTGFGFALLSLPILTAILPPKTAIPIVYLLANLAGIMILIETRKWLDIKRIWPLMMAGVVAAPVGTHLLLILDGNMLKSAIGVITSLTALALFAGFRLQVRDEKQAGVPVGIASGLLGGSTGLAGPPVILFFSNQSQEKQVFRANLTLYFLVLGLSVLASQALNGIVTREVLNYSLWLLPAVFLGTLFGMKLAKRVNETLFRKITLIGVMVSGSAAVGSGLGLF